MIYIASPYAHPDPEVMAQRFHAVCAETAAIMRTGQVPYSPIAHNHYLACNFSLPRGWDFWQRFDLEILSRCDEVWVLMLDGWLESKGVTAEIEAAETFGIPVLYFAVGDIDGGQDN